MTEKAVVLKFLPFVKFCKICMFENRMKKVCRDFNFEHSACIRIETFKKRIKPGVTYLLYCLSKKSWPNLHSNSLNKMCQDFLDKQ